MEEFEGFSFSNYRSIGQESARIFPLKKMNFIIGQNNIGKSNIVRFLNEKLQSLHRNLNASGQKIDYEELDFHQPFVENNDITIGFPLKISEVDKKISSIIHKDWEHHSNYSKGGLVFESYKTLLMSKIFKKDDSGCLWFEYSYKKQQRGFQKNIDIELCREVISNPNIWYDMFRGLSQSGMMVSGYNSNDYIIEVLNRIYYSPSSIPDSVVIPAIRRIGESSGVEINYGGEGIIQQLAKLQNPQHLKQEERIKFNKINDFVRTVLEREEAQIEIPYERDMILVHMDNKVLPLESLGTGIHEVIILAVASTILEKKIICIEEPELHLHPLLQRKLLKYIFEETNNKYIFTTHSAHLLDAVEGEIFHIFKRNQQTLISAIASKGQRTTVCKELGYKASDFLQANCVIWVEGPSDRIYVNFWIKQKDDTLIEGIHYSIMFYGGRLASHLTASDYADENDSSEKEFICLLHLNRNSAILLDSDKSSQQARVNDTKKRLITEFENNYGFSWLTAGREIENYLQADLVEECILEIHPRIASHLPNKGRWDNLLNFMPKNNTSNKQTVTADKIALAKLYIKKYSVNFEVLDLEEKVSALVNFIKSSN